MICKLPDPIINDVNPFENCKLDRQLYADILNLSESGLCICNRWRMGKWENHICKDVEAKPCE